MNYYKQSSERLRYRKLTLNDVDSWMEFFVNNDQLHFVGSDSDKSSRDLSTEWISKQLDRYRNRQFGLLAAVDKVTGLIIGVGGILPRDLNGDRRFEIAYSIKPKYWGMGYATEIARKLKQYGVENDVSNNFISLIHLENVGSMNVAAKNGMKCIGDTVFQDMKVNIYQD